MQKSRSNLWNLRLRRLKPNPPDSPSDSAPSPINQPIFLPHNSYSTEAEDLLIDRILRVFLGIEADYIGRYLDVGAFHPIEASNTYLFYERGWRGVVIEPNPDHCEKFRKLRPRDKVLNVGLAQQASVVPYYRFADSFLNGMNQEWTDFRIRNGQYLGSADVHCITPRELLNYIDTPIDFMSIDIEGSDADVLSCWDWTACRPALICAEVLCTGIGEIVQTDVGRILHAAEYSPISRGWQSAIFVANEAVRAHLSSTAHKYK